MNMNHLKKHFRNSLLIFGVVVLLGACAGGVGYSNSPVIENTPAARQAYLTTELDRVFETQQDALQPGVSAMIIKDGAVVYSRSKGMADIKQGLSITSDPIFDIASIGKPITAIAVMQLMERRFLSLNDSILKWLPNLPSAWHGITIHHLLSHTSGIPDCCSGISLEKFQELDGLNNQQIIQRISHADALLFTPGSTGQYSNSNYIILSEIVAKSSGMSFSEYLKLNIFTPTGMTSYIYGDSPSIDKTLAIGYGLTNKVYGINFAVVGAAGVFASSSDLRKLVSSLLSEKLITLNSLQLMTSDQSKSKVKPAYAAHYGYGWFVPMQSNGFEVFISSGEADANRSLLHINYKNGLVIILLSNGGTTTQQVINSMADIARNTYP